LHGRRGDARRRRRAAAGRREQPGRRHLEGHRQAPVGPVGERGAGAEPGRRGGRQGRDQGFGLAGQAGHLRPVGRRGRRDPGRRDPVRGGPAAVPPGLSADHVPPPVQEQPEHRRRRPAGQHRPRVRHQGERRAGGQARGGGHAMTAATSRADERVADVGLVRRLLIRPELGAVVGAIVVFTFLASPSAVYRSLDGIANWLDPAATLGIMAVAVALLMIGGEFDLSAGVLTGTTGLILVTLATRYGLNVWAAMLAGLVVALAVGLFNGLIVTRTRLPSFIVTLGTFLMLQGVNLGVTKALTGTVQVGGLRSASGYEGARTVFAGTVEIGGSSFRVAILWWLLVTAVATWVLMRSRQGNWIFAVGGDEKAARAVGVPAARTKIALFMTTAFAAWLVGSILALRYTSVQANV